MKNQKLLSRIKRLQDENKKLPLIITGTPTVPVSTASLTNDPSLETEVKALREAKKELNSRLAVLRTENHDLRADNTALRAQSESDLADIVRQKEESRAAEEATAILRAEKEVLFKECC